MESTQPAIVAPSLTTEPAKVAPVPEAKIDIPSASDAGTKAMDNPPSVVPPATTPALTPAPTTPAEAPPVLSEPEVAPIPEEPAIPAETPFEPDILSEETVVEPMVEPAAEEPLTESPEEPAVEPPMAEEPFEAEPTPAEPTDSSINDLFNEPASEATPPMEAEPEQATSEGTSDLDSLFNSEEKEMPAADATENALPTEGSTDSIDDLFDKPTSEMPGTADEPLSPAATEQDTSLDSLFDSSEPAAPAASDSTPATPEATPAEGGVTPEDDIDELFGKPISSSTGADQTMDSDVEMPSTEQSDNDLPKADKPADDESDLDALFGLGASASAPKFDGAEFRQWVDNTGAYSVKARLSVIYSDKVKLLKENGSVTTVPMSRLSEADYGYVKWVTASMTGSTASKLVKKDASPTDAQSTR